MMSSGTERDESDEFLDDIQQGLHPGGSEPRYDPLDRFLVMPNKPSLMDLMRTDAENSELNRPPSTRARGPASAQPMSWDFDYQRDDPPVVSRVHEEPARTSTPRSQSARPKTAIEQPRPRALSNIHLSPRKSHHLLRHRARGNKRQNRHRKLLLTLLQ